MRRTGLTLLATGAPLLLLALLAGGRWAEWVFVVVSLLFPAALCALGLAPGRRRRPARIAIALLALLPVASGVGILCLAGGGWTLLGLPAGTVLMLAGLGLLPLIASSLGYALDARDGGDGGAPSAGKPPGRRDEAAR